MKTVELFVCMAVAAALSAFSDTPERPHDYTPLCYNNPQATPYLKTGLICHPMVFDYDNDGIPEVILGCEDGFLYHLKNNDWKK